MQKNWMSSHEKDFVKPSLFMPHLLMLKRVKNSLGKEIILLVKKEIYKFKDIAGVGGVSLGCLLGYANPEDFRSLSTYLRYCGYKGHQFKVTKKYCRRLRTHIRQLATQVVRHKDAKFFPIYSEMKQQLGFGKAINRLSTLLMKEIYRRLKNGKEL